MTREQMLAHLELRGWHPIYYPVRAVRRENTQMYVTYYAGSGVAYVSQQAAGITIACEDWDEYKDADLAAFVKRDLESLGAS